MSDEPRVPQDDKRPEEADAPRDLRLPAALVRTALSSEQTLMSWVRTSVSLFTFGFSIAKFFQYLVTEQQDAQWSAGPRRLGISLICVGVLMLMLAMADHVRMIRQMRRQGLPADSGSFLPLGSAVAFLAIGLVALVSVFLKWHL
jgi:inner membrane protein YidH